MENYNPFYKSESIPFIKFLNLGNPNSNVADPTYSIPKTLPDSSTSHRFDKFSLNSTVPPHYSSNESGVLSVQYSEEHVPDEVRHINMLPISKLAIIQEPLYSLNEIEKSTYIKCSVKQQCADSDLNLKHNSQLENVPSSLQGINIPKSTPVSESVRRMIPVDVAASTKFDTEEMISLDPMLSRKNIMNDSIALKLGNDLHQGFQSFRIPSQESFEALVSTSISNNAQSFHLPCLDTLKISPKQILDNAATFSEAPFRKAYYDTSRVNKAVDALRNRTTDKNSEGDIGENWQRPWTQQDSNLTTTTSSKLLNSIATSLSVPSDSLETKTYPPVEPHPLQCPTCKYKFARRSNLLKHIRSIHQKERRFGCVRCGYYFKRRDHRDKHIKSVHLKERNFSCDICGVAFAEKFNRDKHRTTIHATRRPLQCGCGAYFRYCERMANCLRCKRLGIELRREILGPFCISL